MDFLDRLAIANRMRNKLWDPNGVLDEAFHAVELAGETGELCNIIKKRLRERLGLKGSRASTGQLIGEIGDVLIVLSLLANACNVDLTVAAREAFNKKSIEMNFDIFI
jgi:NTP pyrophosphatase (non-canonical NTP hydrolase)